MAFRRRSGSSWIDPSRIQRRSGSSWVDVQTIQRRSGSSWITVYTAYTGMSGNIFGFSASHNDPANPVPPPTYPVVATGGANVSGGSGNYTYRWSVTSGIARISGSTTGSTAAIVADVNNQTTATGNVRCVVSDGVSNITLNFTYSLGYYGGQPM